MDTQKEKYLAEEKIKEEKYLAIKQVLKGLSIAQSIDIVEYFIRQIKRDVTIPEN